MSMVFHTPEQSTPGTSPAAPTSSTQSRKPQRVLSCILCQQRKVKCDRKFPCGNCVKSHVQCVPAALAPHRRRRRFPERDLLERLRKYESLLRQNRINFDPLHPGSSEDREPGGVDGVNDSDDDHPEGEKADCPSPATTSKSDQVYDTEYVVPVELPMKLTVLGISGIP
jgi:hypothetical protein